MSTPDPWLDRIVMTALAAALLLSGAGITFLASRDHDIPPALSGLAGTAAGVLAGWFGRRACGPHGGKNGAGLP